jgi:hypothetical protein
VRIIEPAPSIGDQAVLVRMDKTILGLHASAAVVVWRSGSVLGMVITTLTRGDANARAAVRLAALQQARIANPTPLRPRVNDDRLVPLDDPTLGTPVMWLGERLPAHGRLPALNLWATGGAVDLGEPPQPLVRLIYRTPHPSESVTVDVWRPHALRRSLRVPPHDHRCRRNFQVDVTDARASITATRSRTHGRCPHGGARLEAVAFFHGVGVTIHAGGRSRRAPYDSRAGLRALLRALRPHEPRPLPAP